MVGNHCLPSVVPMNENVRLLYGEAGLSRASRGSRSLP